MNDIGPLDRKWERRLALVPGLGGLPGLFDQSCQGASIRTELGLVLFNPGVPLLFDPGPTSVRSAALVLLLQVLFDSGATSVNSVRLGRVLLSVPGIDEASFVGHT